MLQVCFLNPLINVTLFYSNIAWNRIYNGTMHALCNVHRHAILLALFFLLITLNCIQILYVYCIEHYNESSS